MHVVLIVILFIIGIVLTVKGGDWFVDAATWLAEATGIPKLIIGATIVSFATTLPELLVSSIATWQGHFDMAIGNAVGSVNANTGLIMALSVFFLGGLVERKAFKNKGALFIIACVLMLIFAKDNVFSVFESIIMLIVCALFLADSILQGKETLSERHEKPQIDKKDLRKNIGLFVIGAVAMAIGAKLMVDNGEELAHILKVPDIIISITLIAIGTSLPELVTTITAIRKKQSDISIGNIVGANVMDLCFVTPVSGIIAAARSGAELTMDESYFRLHVPVAIAVAVIAVIPTLINKKTSKWQGIALFVVYIGYLVASIIIV